MVVQNNKEIEVLREGGRHLAAMFEELKKVIVPGVNTQALEDRARELVREAGDIPAFLGYTPWGAKYPYPAALCVSVNDEVVHGIPNGERARVLQEGDILAVDMGIIYEGLVLDGVFTIGVGDIDDDARKLISAAEEALAAAIAKAHAGNTTGDIGVAVEAVAKKHGFTTPHELGGHGVGKKVHEEPFIPNYGRSGEGEKLMEGMVLAIEPIIIAGKNDIYLADDGYTYKTCDGSRTAQFEHTVLVGTTDAEVLTIL